MSKPVVKTNEGQLKGKVCKLLNDKKYYAFKGIPYAKPPLDELRFAPPEDPESWQGIRDATKDCNICAQLDKETLQVIGDEDCLYLNVYTPYLPGSKGKSQLPVMVFIHGGGFVFGNGTDDTIHGPDYLVEKDVVIVSLNYRLGILGFLSVDCKEAPGNMGLKDQVQALKWVNKNIQNFNGDPNNVTVFGVSAGGASVEYLLLTDMTKGLIHKAIAQSGSSLNRWAQNNNVKELAAKIPIIKGKVITDDAELVRYLKSMPLKDLITSSMTVVANQLWKGGINFGFVPTIEKKGDWEPFISRSTYELLSEGNFHNIPFMSGFCRREGLLMFSPPFKPVIDRLIREKDFLAHLPFEIDDTQKDHFANKLKTVYLEGERMFDEADSFAIDFFSDIDFIGGVYNAAKMISQKNSNVYLYEFAYDGGLNYLKKKLNIDRKGACHGDEGGYLIKSALLQGNLSDSDKVVKEKMCQLWTDFARYGEPTQTSQKDSEGELFWEPLTETGLAILQMDETFEMKYETNERIKLMTELYTKFHT